ERPEPTPRTMLRVSVVPSAVCCGVLGQPMPVETTTSSCEPVVSWGWSCILWRGQCCASCRASWSVTLTICMICGHEQEHLQQHTVTSTLHHRTSQEVLSFYGHQTIYLPQAERCTAEMLTNYPQDE
ncbi:hypothetical protein L3Q82_019297, partial [Scortum barcoo]